MTRLRVICVLVIEDKPALVDRLSIRDDLRVVMLDSDGDAAAAGARDFAEVVVIGPSVAFARATEVCRRVRRDPRLATVPVLLFGSREARDEEVNAFAAGADDYLVGSVTTPALAARLHALVRRTRTGAGAGDRTGNRAAPVVHVGDGEAIRAGRLSVEPDTYCVRVDGRTVELSAGEFRVLWELAVHRGTTVLSDQLARSAGPADGVTSAKTVRSHVAGLRRKLGDAAAQLKTVRGVGYRLVGE